MFTDEKVPCWLKKVSFEPGKDSETLMTLRFFVTPITYQLAKQVDPKIADRLFRSVGGDWLPVKESDRMGFHPITPEPCSIKYQLHEEIEDGGGFIPHAAFSGLDGMKVFADKPDFTLAFNASFVIVDQHIAWTFITRLRSTFFLTFARVQETLPFEAAAWPKCEVCNVDATMLGSGGGAYCDQHAGAAVGESVEPLTDENRSSVRKGGPTKKARKKAAAENEAQLAGKPKAAEKKATDHPLKPLTKGRKR